MRIAPSIQLLNLKADNWGSGLAVGGLPARGSCSTPWTLLTVEGCDKIGTSRTSWKM